MATIAATDMTGSGARQVTVTTLTASDTFTYNAGKNPTLVLNNVTAGALTVNIDGDGAGTISVQGADTFDISGGYDTPSIAAGETYAIPLRTIAKYLAGTIAVTGGSGIEAQLLEY